VPLSYLNYDYMAPFRSTIFRIVLGLALCAGILFSISFASTIRIPPIAAKESLDKQHSKPSLHQEWKQSLLEGNKVQLSGSDIREQTEGKEYSDQSVVVVLKNNLSPADVLSVAQQYDSQVPIHQQKEQRTVGNGKYVVLKVPDQTSVEQFLSDLNADPQVLFAEPSYKRTLFWTPNDTNFSQQWQLQNYSTGNYGIEMPKAWDYVDAQLDSQIGPGSNYGGRSTVVVAVIDTGLAFEDRTVDQPGTYEDTWDFDAIPDRPVTLWTHSGETAGDGIDNDSNGYIDDYNGVNIDDYYNYELGYGGHTTEDGYPDDDYGHGTHVSNIIAGNTNNSTAGAGIAFKVQIMPIKIFDHLGSVWSQSVIDALAYAIDNDADVINMSFGGSSPSTVEETLTDEAAAAGIIPVAASGNSGNTVVQYPAGYSNVIAVGASNPNGSRSWYSSYGGWIDLVAPVGSSGAGDGFREQNYQCYNVASQSNPLPCTQDTAEPQVWFPGGGSANSFKTFTVGPSQGTSFASPQVAGVAALIKSLHETWGFAQIQYVLNNSAKDVGTSGYDSETGYGILNANNAVQSMKDSGDEGDLVVWSDWIQDSSIRSNQGPELLEFDGRLYETVRDYNTGQIKIRSTDDGVFNGEPNESWSTAPNGYTSSTPALAEFDGRLYIAVRGSSTNRIYTKSMNTSNEWDSSWTYSSGATGASVGMTTFNSHLYQAVKGISGNQIYIRSSDDGNFDGEIDEQWYQISGATQNGIELESFDGRLYMSVSGVTSNAVYIRSTADGTFTTGDSSENWNVYGGKTSGRPSLAVHDGYLYQAVVGQSTPYIYTRFSSDGSSWTTWSTFTGTTGNPPSIGTFSVTGFLYQSVTGHSSSNLFLRNKQ
jgi:serine protease